MSWVGGLSSADLEDISLLLLEVSLIPQLALLRLYGNLNLHLKRKGFDLIWLKWYGGKGLDVLSQQIFDNCKTI
jgi:hypothetical protein